MSTIRKTPYVETLINGLSSENKATLLGIVNGSGSNVAASIGNLPADDVKAVNFEFPDGKLKSALYVKTASHTALLCYNRFQDLLILEIDSNNNINKIDEYCDIEELRTTLKDSAGGGTAWVERVSEVLDYDSDTNTLEDGANLYVDGMIKTDEIVSATEVSEENVGFVEFDPSDNHWHLTNTTVDDTLTIASGGELELASGGDLGSNLQAEIRSVVGVPDATGHLGKVLKHETTGNFWSDYTPLDIEVKNAVGTAISGNLKFVKCSQSEYDALTKDNNTFYIIVG